VSVSRRKTSLKNGVRRLTSCARRVVNSKRVRRMVWCCNRIRNTAGTAASRSGSPACSSEFANGRNVVLKPYWY
jgi:hypothetical protein